MQKREETKKTYCKICRVLLLVMGVLFFGYLYTEKSMAASDIYMAGAPDSSPFEYYDGNKNTYIGIIPDLLRKVAKEAGITIEYQYPSHTDDRIRLADNVQVDVISSLGISNAEMNRLDLNRGIELFRYTEDGQQVSVALLYTKSMTEENIELLEQAIQNITPLEMNDFFIQYAKKENVQPIFGVNVRVIVIVLVILLFLSLLIVVIGKKREKYQMQMASTDIVTDRGNINAWKQKYEETIFDENLHRYAVLNLFCGIDQIAHIYGYAEAESALKLISDTCVPFLNDEKEAFARFNEFNYVFFIQYTGVEGMKSRINMLQERLIQIFKEEKRYFLDFHTGIYRLSNENKEVLKALQYSELAMEYARNHFLPYAVYDEVVEKETISNYAMEHEAIHGLMQHEFIMYLQPIVDLNRRKICAAEALVRWQNPRRGLLKPGDFLDILKKKQLMGEMNMEIFRQGCRYLKEHGKNEDEFGLLFNFTVENIGNDQFPAHLAAIAKDNQVEPSRIMIQLNQVVEMSRSKLFTETIRNLRAYGFDICLAGLELDYVFFEYLESGINMVKLRPELIHRLNKPEGRKVVGSLIKLCHSLDLELLSVGVENKEQEDFLKEYGCERATGFYFHYPVSQDEFNNLVLDQHEKNIHDN